MSDDTPLADEQFYGAIGRLTISWAHADFALDCIVEIVHYGLGGKDIETEIPRSLSRKLIYLRKAIRRIPIPEDAIDGYISLFDAISAEADIRHDIIHGFIIAYERGAGRATIMRTIRDRTGNVTKREIPISTGDILNAANRVNRLGKQIFMWVNEIRNVIDEIRVQSDEQT